VDIFRYSPLAAALFAPLNWLPDGMAAVLWRLVSAAVFLLGFGWWQRALLPRESHGDGKGATLLLTLPFLAPNLFNGQINPVMLGLLLASLAAAQHQRFGLSGACTALAIWLKLYPVAVGLLLILLYPRRFTPWFLLGLVMGFALPFVLQDPAYVLEQYRQWLHYLQVDNRECLPWHYWLRDVRLLFLVAGWQLPAGLYPLFQLAVAGMIAIFCMLARWRRWPDSELLVAVTHLSVVWMTAFGPSTESTTWCLLGPSLATVLLQSWRRPAARWWRGLLLLSYLLLVGTFVSVWFPWQALQLAPWGTQPLAGLLFLGALLANGIVRLRARVHAEVQPFAA
jgi:hypothetical protein